MPNAAPAPGLGPETSSENCLSRLRELGFTLEPAEPPHTRNAQCQIDVPIHLLSVPVSSHPQQTVVLKEKPILACAFAENFGRWISDLAAPVIAGRMGIDLVAVRTGPGFECRNRNGSPTGKLSAHAQGRAIDVSHFELSDGGSLFIKPNGNASHADTIATLRRAACGWFTTILGPGSDPSHTDHLHLDVEPHGSSDRYRICQ
ncbi:extensin-like domain-containing protein [Microvirga rosea]|uniref:extensin-like domain-containing protein n=1 Tax=Microvirga rosea TaxID=2715425 RepID=UPI001D0A3D37|nr:extensin family protein [Microvirga rosea]